jgi:hypothetical protein
MGKKNWRDIPPWEDSPYNTFDRPLPPPGWSSSQAKAIRVEKARNRAQAFLGAHGCRTGRIRGDRQLNHLLSVCFGVAIDRSAKPKRELRRAVRAIADMGPKARKLRMRAAHKSGHPAIRQYWNAGRIVE